MFHHDVRVRFAETDAQGIAHHASYVVWLEEARVAWLDAFAGGYKGIRERGIEALTTGVHLDYKAAAGFDDVIRVWTALRRDQRRTVPLRLRVCAAATRPMADGVHDARDRRSGHPPSRARAGVVRRRRGQGRGPAGAGSVVVGGASPSATGASAPAGTAASSFFGFAGGGFLVPIRTMVGSPT